MEWVEQGIGLLQQLPPLGVLAVIFLIAYIENVFPPSPSDVLLVFAGALIGFGTLVANRFLAGTRALVSFFAGMSRMNLAKTTALCAVSAAVWNTLLLLLGKALGSNWRMAGHYLMLYSKLVTAITVAAVLLFAAWWYWKKRRVA
jgi:membrane protein DedA with SNARE-associated domain